MSHRMSWTRLFSTFGGLFSVAVGILACEGATRPMVAASCAPGAYLACRCMGGGTEQCRCLADGSAYAACECPVSLPPLEAEKGPPLVRCTPNATRCSDDSSLEACIDNKVTYTSCNASFCEKAKKGASKGCGKAADGSFACLCEPPCASESPTCSGAVLTTCEAAGDKKTTYDDAVCAGKKLGASLGC